jgi:hypothetical protein
LKCEIHCDFYLTSHHLFATSTTAHFQVVIPGGNLKVTHDFYPAAEAPNLYQVTIRLENIGGAMINDL